jgi:hypothetical protein
VLPSEVGELGPDLGEVVDLLLRRRVAAELGVERADGGGIAFGEVVPEREGLEGGAEAGVGVLDALELRERRLGTG